MENKIVSPIAQGAGGGEEAASQLQGLTVWSVTIVPMEGYDCSWSDALDEFEDRLYLTEVKARAYAAQFSDEARKCCYGIMVREVTIHG